MVAYGLSPVWLQVQVQAGPAAGAGAGPSAISAVLHLPRFLPFFLQNTELDREVFCVVMKTRFGEILLTELCRTKFLSSL